MSYTIDIIDTTNPDVVLELKKAGAKTLLLSWNGGDDKLPRIISSSFKFTMFDDENQDGRYDILFTGNETKYKINVIHDVTGVVVWQGFLLPDLYNEPYTNNVVMVDFEATDGLGRLKGKYLPDAFYSLEKSVIEIISACLAATGLELDLYFAPAIENRLVKDYNAIYIDTSGFLKGTKKTDAYAILSTLVEDMMCVLYQADNRWYFEGVNRRQIRVINYKHYNSAGVYVGLVEFTKLIKEHNAVVTPFISVVPPYGIITVSTELKNLKLPDTIDKEKNDGWAVPPGTLGRIYASDWIGVDGYDAFAIAYDYKIELPAVFGRLIDDIDASKFVKLKRKIYVSKGDKISFKSSFSPKVVYEENFDGITVENGTRLQILVDGAVVKEGVIGFDADVNKNTFKLEFDFIIQKNGLLDIKIFQPYTNYNVNYISGFIINSMSLEKPDFEENFFIQNIVNDEFTLTKDVDLTFADDNTGISKAFLLAKLKTASETFITKEVTVLYAIQDVLGNNYSVVDLQSANLIADNIDSVYYNDVLLEGLEVIYNLNEGEEMVVKTPDVIGAGEVLLVNIYAENDLFGNRDHWQQWTDAVYLIEKNRYAQVVADVYRRMHNVAHYKIDMTLKRSVKFNDIITFPYKIAQNYIITNCTWDLDSNHTTITAIKGYYLNSVVTNPDDNISPIVDAGEDIIMPAIATTASLLAVASDPDGIIVSYLWEQVSGASTAVINSPIEAATLISNLIGAGGYVFKVTVTDNDGATAFDTVTVRKNVPLSITQSPVCTSDVYQIAAYDSYKKFFKRIRIFSIIASPEIPPGITINVLLKFTVFKIVWDSITDYDDFVGSVCDPLGPSNKSQILIQKNGALVYHFGLISNPETVNITMIAGTELKVQLAWLSYFESVYRTTDNLKCEVISATDLTGSVVYTGLPFTVYTYDEFQLALKTPQILSATVISFSQINLSIKDSNTGLSDPINIYVEYCVNDGDDVWVVHGTTARTSTSYSVVGLVTNTSYKFRIKSVVTEETFESQYSNIIGQKTL